MRKSIPLAALLAVSLADSIALPAALLSVNFTHPADPNGSFAREAGTVAGVTPAGNWNQITGGGVTASIAGPLLNDGSVASGTSVSLDGGTSTVPNYFTSEKGTPTNHDQRLMWYTFGSAANSQYSTIEVVGLPADFAAAGYQIHVYSHRNLALYAGTYQYALDLDRDAVTDQTVYGTIVASGGFTAFTNAGQSLTAAGARPVNYVTFQVAPGADSFRISVDNLNGSHTALNGLQIVAGPPPVPVLDGAVVTASSVLHDSNGPKKAVDGDLSDTSRWLTADVPGPHWLRLDLPEVRPMAGYAIYSGGENADPVAAFYLEEWSGTQWELIPSSQVTGNTAPIVVLPFDQQVSTSALRLVLPADGILPVREIVVWRPGETPPDDGSTEPPVDPVEPVIFVNQSGYNLGAPKRFTAIGLGDTTDFTLLTADDGTPVFRGQLQGQAGDFSAFNPRTEREFIIRIGGTTSDPFRIGPWWLERVTCQNSIDFMVAARNYVGNVTTPARSSYAWRDDHHFAYSLSTLVNQYLAHPALYERMPLQITYATPRDNAWGALEPYAADAPDIVKMIHWGADVIVTQGLIHEMLKSELAYFLYAWPWIQSWLPAQNYQTVKQFVLDHWSDTTDDRTYPYDESPANGHNLLEIKTKVGSTKGAYPPGFSVLPNTLMAIVLDRESDTRAETFRTAARAQVAWIVDNLDVTDPQATKGQRMSENLLMIGLASFARLDPQGIPEGFGDFITAWSTVAVQRSANLWDFRKLTSGDVWVTFIDGVATAWNEPGNLAGFPAAALEAAELVGDPALRQRLEQLAWAAIENMFGRNPVGRHFSYDAPREIEGVERGWFSFYRGGIGQLAEVPFVLDGGPKNEHYPYHPELGNIGWTEGWVSFNTAYNRTLAVMAFHYGAVELEQRGDLLAIRLRAPLNFDYAADEPVILTITTSQGDAETVLLREPDPYALFLEGHLPIQSSTARLSFDGNLQALPGESLRASYGLGYYQRSQEIQLGPIQPWDTDGDSLPDEWELSHATTLNDLDTTTTPPGGGLAPLAAFVFDLDPFVPEAIPVTSAMEVDAFGRWLVIRTRENTAYPQARADQWEISQDLAAWRSVEFDDIDALLETEDNDPDGDGSARQLKVRVRLPDTGGIFVRPVPGIDP